MIPGDLVFFDGTGAVSRAIQLAQWFRWRSGSRFNHVAILDAYTEGKWTLVQAEGRGVTRGAALGDSYTHVPLPNGVDRQKVLQFARSQVGRSYGFLTIASIVLTIFTPKFVNFELPNTWICSAVAAESLRFGGWLHQWPDIYQTSPAELYQALEGE